MLWYLQIGGEEEPAKENKEWPVGERSHSQLWSDLLKGLQQWDWELSVYKGYEVVEKLDTCSGLSFNVMSFIGSS